MNIAESITTTASRPETGLQRCLATLPEIVRQAQIELDVLRKRLEPILHVPGSEVSTNIPPGAIAICCPLEGSLTELLSVLQLHCAEIKDLHSRVEL